MLVLYGLPKLKSRGTVACHSSKWTLPFFDSLNLTRSYNLVIHDEWKGCTSKWIQMDSNGRSTANDLRYSFGTIYRRYHEIRTHFIETISVAPKWVASWPDSTHLRSFEAKHIGSWYDAENPRSSWNVGSLRAARRGRPSSETSGQRLEGRKVINVSWSILAVSEQTSVNDISKWTEWVK